MLKGLASLPWPLPIGALAINSQISPRYVLRIEPKYPRCSRDLSGLRVIFEIDYLTLLEIANKNAKANKASEHFAANQSNSEIFILIMR
jgi:hypothetical protein